MVKQRSLLTLWAPFDFVIDRFWLGILRLEDTMGMKPFVKSNHVFYIIFTTICIKLKHFFFFNHRGSQNQIFSWLESPLKGVCPIVEQVPCGIAKTDFASSNQSFHLFLQYTSSASTVLSRPPFSLSLDINIYFCHLTVRHYNKNTFQLQNS